MNDRSNRAKILHDSHLSEELSGDPGAAGAGAAPGQDGHVGQEGMAGHGGFLCARSDSLQKPERNRTQRKRRAPHNAQKVDLMLERDIVHVRDGGPMSETTVNMKLSDGVCTV